MNTPIKVLSNPAIFAGSWKGQGKVLKRTGEVVATYLETAIFEVVRQTPDFVLYRLHQDTRNAESQKPMHTETGFCKIMIETGKATSTLVHPFLSGFVSELSEGQCSDQVLTLVAKDFQRATIADSVAGEPVTGFKRKYTRNGDKLVYDQYLSSGGRDLYHHLHCELELQK
jgi:THAP4-like, heme-binding beta-barrel domain